MKKNSIISILVFILLISGFSPVSFAQEEKSSVFVYLKYYSYNDKLPFVRVETKTRIERRFFPVGNIDVTVYLDDISEENLVGKVKTDHRGLATLPIPPTLKSIWDAGAEHIFYAVSDESELYEEGETDLEIVRARLVIDTINEDGSRSIMATLQQMTSDGWMNVTEEAEVKIGVKRFGGIIGDISYTDEEGVALAEYELADIPGDNEGLLTLVAKVEDHDLYGNLIAELVAPWGVPMLDDNSNFYERSLWATRERTPFWLLISANAILLSVWGVLIYLAFQLIKIRKLGIKVS
jgi:hypothetical protein